MAKDIVVPATLQGGSIRAKAKVQGSGVETKASLGNVIFVPSKAGVKSVNGKTGDVVLTPEDVGALPANTPIPSLDGYATEV